MMTAVYRWFENWVYPFREPANLRPPASVGGFLWHYVGQAKFAFFAMLVIGGIAPLVDYLWPLWEEENRALHDFLVDTRTVLV